MKGTEIMAKEIQKPKLSLIKPEERAPDGNLLPGVRERVIQSMQTYLRQVGYLNVSEMAQQLGLSRQSTKKLTDEIIAQWRTEIENQVIVQVKWHLEMIKDMSENPETFSENKRALVRLKSAFLNKINTLMKILIK